MDHESSEQEHFPIVEYGRETLKSGGLEINAARVESQAGMSALATTTIGSNGVKPQLVHYQNYSDKGIVTEPGGQLISFNDTKASWQGPLGLKPEEYMAEAGDASVGLCPSNFGWQKNAFLIEKGAFVSLPNDSGEMSGEFDCIGFSDHWDTFNVSISGGKVAESSTPLEKISAGFSMPLILKDGKIAPVGSIVNDPRLTADYRNVFDFAAGKKMPPRFWELIRRIQPTSNSAGRRMARGGNVVVKQPGAFSPEEFEEFRSLLAGSQLSEYLYIDQKDDDFRLAVIKPLPIQRLPLIGIGFNQDHQIVATTIDGRQENNTGGSIAELAEYMQQQGAITAGLGSAGGDVALVLRDHGEVKVLNSPSGREDGKPATRAVPSFLILH